MTQCAFETELETLHVIPAGRDLVGAEIELVMKERREYRLADSIAAMGDAYEIILIDCPPSLGLLTVNALTAADAVLIPLQCEYYALEGLANLVETVDLVSAELNPRLTIQGILLTMVDARNNLARQVEAEVRSHFGDKVYRTRVPRNVPVVRGAQPWATHPSLRHPFKGRGRLRQGRGGIVDTARAHEPASKATGPTGSTIDFALRRIR